MEKGDDPYQILGISKSDVSDDPSCIKKNFRQLARIHHPDKNRGEDSETAARTFAKINHAYEVLQDEKSRRSYDLSQLHSKQRGYDPNGPTYYDQSPNKNVYEYTDDENGNTWKTKKTPATTSTGRRSSPADSHPRKGSSGIDSFSCRTATTTSTDKVSGKSKTLTFRTTSDGMTTVDVKSSDGSTSSFSASRLDESKHKAVYELFRDHFGTSKANDFFNTNVTGENGVSPGMRQKPSKSKPDSRTKKATKKGQSSSLHRPSSPMGAYTELYHNLPSAANANTFPNQKTTNRTVSKEKKKKAVQVPDTNKMFLSTTKTSGHVNTNFVDENDDSIQSMSVKERVAVNPKTKQKEVIMEITVTKFDGSVETRIERRQA
mmetsp:Transcript_9581/g.28607  ORF Transcript_9581/g.28607 Transcript_9581/m.28607 type:complete len:376 (+) Transcript_9581:149-1276(+)|eukprot:CAMPEP_0172368004 /NCGR_PEP_ID=MMETSP1060-20121228/24859_1 /TAXON_ID=37318 /ORGANISM="Pseudo-nitzschia pungens, Strain cf. cingulata" /LENGTH=375 /DNA_ID=CAMNT_0013092457 /DNA_START=139 /DNA_END=1266 /DNA_ORIENTATION=+